MLTEPATVIFQISRPRIKPDNRIWKKWRLVSSHDAMLFLETVHVKLYGRSRPAHKTCEYGLPYGPWSLWVSRAEGDQGLLVRFMLEKISNVKGFKGSKVQGLQGSKG